MPWLLVLARDAYTTREREAKLLSLHEQLKLSLKAGVAGEGIVGVRLEGRAAKNLPVSIYWSALTTWGLLEQGSSPRQILGASDDEVERVFEAMDIPTRGLPDKLDFALTELEALHLQSRIRKKCGDSLLGYFVNETEFDFVQGPVWRHPGLAGVSDELRQYVLGAKSFSSALHGASLTYHWILARQLGHEENEAARAQEFEQWREAVEDEILEPEPWGLWSRDMLHAHPHTLGPLGFYAEWLSHLLASEGGVPSGGMCRAVTQREARVKQSRRRIGNPGAAKQWKGSAGPSPMEYRWSVARRHLADIHQGLSL